MRRLSPCVLHSHPVPWYQSDFSHLSPLKSTSMKDFYKYRQDLLWRCQKVLHCLSVKRHWTVRLLGTVSALPFTRGKRQQDKSPSELKHNDY